MLTFTDSHCHLDFNALADQLPQVLNECLNANINRIIVPSIGPENWQSVLSIATNNSVNPRIYPCLGFHPWFLDQINDDSITALDNLLALNNTTVIALGEAGIDATIAKEKDNLTLQISIFEQQLSLAAKHQLPVIVHHRRSHPEVYQALKNAQLKYGGIIHAFSGSQQQAKQYIDLGFKLGIGGTITYERAQKTIKAVAKLPVESLVLETDAPSMPLSGYQGQANHPKRLIDVFKRLCEIRNESPEELATQIELNIDQVFGFTR